jgi:hypothetical protein
MRRFPYLNLVAVPVGLMVDMLGGKKGVSWSCPYAVEARARASNRPRSVCNVNSVML